MPVIAFRTAVENKDSEAMAAALSPDVVFSSPAVFKPYVGRDTVMYILRAVLQVFEDFQYVDELTGDNSHGLVFHARIGDKALEGWDYLTVDDDGLITHLTVMIRPLSGLLALRDAMGAQLVAGVATPDAR